MQLFADIFWGIWLAMLIVGDPILNWGFGERYTATHFLVTKISTGLRVPVIAWIAWHFIVTHKKA